MDNPPPSSFDAFFGHETPPRTSTPTSQVPPFGSSYAPAVNLTPPPQYQQPQYQQYQQQPTVFPGCYRPQQDWNPSPQYPQQPPTWNQPQHYQQPYPPHHQYQPQPQYPPQPPLQPEFCSQPPIEVETEIGSSSRKPSKYKKPKKTTEEKSSRVTWSEDESLALSKAWMHISEDGTVATDQKNDTFWWRIKASFEESGWTRNKRTKDALSGKWDAIRRSVMLFNGMYSQLLESRPSGSDDAAVVVKACAEYQATKGTPFTHHKCWEFLKDKPKFLNPDQCVLGRRNKRRDTGATMETPFNLDDDEYAAPSFDAPSRPVRPSKSQKSTTSSSAGGSSSSEVLGKMNETLQQHHARKQAREARRMVSLAAADRVNKMKELTLALQFLETDLSNLPEVTKNKMLRKKNKIVAKINSGYYNDEDDEDGGDDTDE